MKYLIFAVLLASCAKPAPQTKMIPNGPPEWSQATKDVPKGKNEIGISKIPQK